MKTIITAAIIATATLTATVSNAGTYSFCKDYSKLMKSVAIARDKGVSASSIYQMAIDNNLGQKLALSLVDIVYVKGEIFSPKVLETVAFETCLGEGV